MHAPELTEVPPHLPEGPYRDALELANKATFSQPELDADQKVKDEIERVRDLAEAKLAEGEAVGFTKGHMSGKAEGKAEAILALLMARGIASSEGDRARITNCSDAATLDAGLVRAISASSVEDVFNRS